jgi:hypothetical protein
MSLKPISIELHFDTLEEAKQEGYHDATPVHDDLPELGYFVVVTFMCSNYEVTEYEEMDLEVDLDLLLDKDDDQMELLA